MTITQLTEKAIAVTGLPEGASDFDLEFNNALNNHQLYWKAEFMGIKDVKACRDLPEGNWRILGFAQDLTEDDWKRVVEEHFLPFHNFESIGFEDYEYLQGMGLLNTATESGHSLLKSKGLHVSNPYEKLHPIAVLTIGTTKYNEQDKQWQSAELLTNPLILIQ